MKTEQVTGSRGQRCGDIQLTDYLVNEEGPVSLVLDLHIDHERFGGTSDPSRNGHLHYDPNDIDKSLNESLDAKPGLVPVLVPGIQDYKNPGSLGQTWDQAKSLKLILIDSIFLLYPVLSPLVTLGVSPVFSKNF